MNIHEIVEINDEIMTFNEFRSFLVRLIIVKIEVSLEFLVGNLKKSRF